MNVSRTMVGIAPVIWFALGLSGAGKSWVGHGVASRNNWLHLEIDQWGPGISDGLDVYGLREAWQRFESFGDSTLLAHEIKVRYRERGQKGAILTFPSSRVLSVFQIRALGVEVKAFYLVGAKEHCSELSWSASTGPSEACRSPTGTATMGRCLKRCPSRN
ncbi:MAG: hypothetical protein ACRDGM_09845 [bacterium]